MPEHNEAIPAYDTSSVEIWQDAADTTGWIHLGAADGIFTHGDEVAKERAISFVATFFQISASEIKELHKRFRIGLYQIRGAWAAIYVRKTSDDKVRELGAVLG